jgi:heme A synthase
VKLGNTPGATVAHFIGAAAIIALLAMTLIRAGGMGGASALEHPGSRKAMRGAMAAMGLALLVVLLGGLTAKYPGANVGCLAFPHCGPNPGVEAGARHIQLTHRTLAFLLFFHVGAMTFILRARRSTESPVVVRAAAIAFGLVLLQMLVAGGMIGMHLPLAWRSAHQAVGMGIWLATFAFAYLAKRAAA